MLQCVMVIQPKVRGFLCLTTHPHGCENNVRDEWAFFEKKKYSYQPKNVLVIGGSTGYGLSSRICGLAALGANVLNVSLERQGKENKPGSPGWYNNRAVETIAKDKGVLSLSIDGDAFSAETKKNVIQALEQNDFGPLDLVIYSVAAPRRVDEDGKTYTSTLKPLGNIFRAKNIGLAEKNP